MNPIRLTHFFSHFASLGGVQSMLRHHLAHDGEWGVPSNVVAFFDPTNGLHAAVTGLGLSWRDGIASTRRKFATALTARETGVALYHNAWGMPFLADLDKAHRRLSLLHSDLPIIQPMIRSQRGLIDGILCVNAALKAQAQACLPQFDAERIGVVPTPITPPADAGEHAPLQGRPLVCGFVGRVEIEQKRVDRLPHLCRVFEQTGIDYRLEILGDGPDRPRLASQFQNNSKVRLHGRKTGPEYWQILGSCDVILFVSDYEGLPIALLEALSVGVLPIYPRIQSGGDDYVAKVNGDFLYPPEDWTRVAQILRRLTQASDDAIQSMRASCRRLAEPHLGDSYERIFSEFIRKIHEQPRISAASFPRRPFYWSDHYPYAFLKRFYYGALFKRNDGAAA